MAILSRLRINLSFGVLVDGKVAAFNARFGTSWVIESEWVEVETYSERVSLSQVYLADISHQSGDLVLNVESGILSIDDYELARLQPLSVGLYLFLFEYANLARNQGFSFIMYLMFNRGVGYGSVS